CRGPLPLSAPTMGGVLYRSVRAPTGGRAHAPDRGGGTCAAPGVRACADPFRTSAVVLLYDREVRAAVAHFAGVFRDRAVLDRERTGRTGAFRQHPDGRDAHAFDRRLVRRG